jgi:hypothetical protein
MSAPKPCKVCGVLINGYTPGRKGNRNWKHEWHVTRSQLRRKNAEVHYRSFIEGLPIYNGTIVGGPVEVQDEPGEDTYTCYLVLKTGAGSPQLWPLASMGLGHAELVRWPS